MRAQIEQSFREGNLAQAYELCRSALTREPGQIWVGHRAVLCLIKSGALDRAEALFRTLGLDAARDDEDCLVLQARLAKARALEADPGDRPALALQAAEAYAGIARQTEGHYPAVNAAALYLLAGKISQARGWARQVLGLRRHAIRRITPEARYYRCASEAEAHLILGEEIAARLALSEALEQDPENRLAHATTRRQVAWICACLGMSDPFSWSPMPRPAHYAGNLFSPASVDAEAQAELARKLDEVFRAEAIGPLYGALAAGADIMIGEAAIRHRRALSLVLPVPTDVFIDVSVRPLGSSWVARADAVLSHAEEVVELSTERRILSAESLNFASEVAMGLARSRADILATRPIQLLISRDGLDAPMPDYGTVRDGIRWRDHGLDQVLIRMAAPGLHPDDVPRFADSPGSEPVGEVGRPVMRAMIFADIANSSQVPDHRIDVFVSEVLAPLVESVVDLPARPVYQDSWGDGLFFAFESAVEAAQAADALRSRFSAIDLSALCLPDQIDIRIGGHFGPVHERDDPLHQRRSLFGAQVAIAARIERATVPGSIFVSTPFAAALRMGASDRFKCEYVGRTEIDRDLPPQSLHALRTIAAASIEAGHSPAANQGRQSGL